MAGNFFILVLRRLTRLRNAVRLNRYFIACMNGENKNYEMGKPGAMLSEGDNCKNLNKIITNFPDCQMI